MARFLIKIVVLQICERKSLPSKNFPCISMDMLQIGALVLLGRLVEAGNTLWETVSGIERIGFHLGRL